MSKKKAKLPDSIFEVDTSGDIETEFRGMPEFNQPNNGAYRQVIVSFEDEAGIAEFFRLLNQSYTDKTKSVWFPDREMNRVQDLFYYDERTVPEDVKNNQNGTT
jgi:hypothetical protein